MTVHNAALGQGLPDGDGVDIVQIVLLDLGIEAILLNELGDPALHLGPEKRRSFGAFRADRKRSFAVAAVKLMGQPRSGVFLPCMVFHVADNGVFALDPAIPVLDSPVNVIVRKWAQQLMEFGIGFVCHFPVQPLAKLRHIGEQTDQLYIVGSKNSAAHSSITLDHSVFIIAVTAGVPVSDVLGNSLQHDGLVFLMQLPEGGNGLLRHILPQNIGRFRVGRLGLQGIFFGQSLFRLDFVELLLFLFGEIAALLNQIGDPLGNLLPCEMHIRAAAFFVVQALSVMIFPAAPSA